jgi:hypothetical protein
VNAPNIQKPRCFLVYALAPEGLSAARANELFNAYVSDAKHGLALFHDHFIGQRGGMTIFFVETEAEREALKDLGELLDWQVNIHPLIFPIVLLRLTSKLRLHLKPTEMKIGKHFNKRSVRVTVILGKKQKQPKKYKVCSSD